MDDEYYVGLHHFTGKADRVLRFSAERKCTQDAGLQLPSVDALKGFTSGSFNDLQEKFGPPHTSVGYGATIPMYITDDAHIARFSVDYLGFAEVELTINDLFTGEKDG